MDDIISVLLILLVEASDSLQLFGEEIPLTQELILDGFLGIPFHLHQELVILNAGDLLRANFLDLFHRLPLVEEMLVVHLLEHGLE